VQLNIRASAEAAAALRLRAAARGLSLGEALADLLAEAEPAARAEDGEADGLRAALELAEALRDRLAAMARLAPRELGPAASEEPAAAPGPASVPPRADGAATPKEGPAPDAPADASGEGSENTGLFTVFD
jgi:hypothetical protein